MENRNPYASPRANVADAAGSEEYGEINIFRPDGRIGRVRYIGYSVGLGLLIAGGGVGLSAVATAAGQPVLGGLILAGAYLVLYVLQFLMTIQRAHDFNTTGWLSLLLLVPLVSLIFCFIPGTKGENRFGPPPPPNTGGAIALACIVPVFAIIGILAAISIPAYQDYTIRAQVSEGLNLAAAAKAAVAEAYLNTDVVPVSRLDAGMTATATDTSGKYVESVDVAHGTILIIYGGEANGLIAGSMLALQPFITADKSVVWQCGRGRVPPNAVAMEPTAVPADATNLETRYLPSACRP